MNTSTKYKPLLITLWGVSILWIYMSSLVNFHQHQIWHKNLIPQVVASTKDHEKSKAGQKSLKNSHKKTMDSPVVFCALPGSSTSNVDLQSITLILPVSVDCCHPVLRARGHGLRAPPLV